MSLPEASYDDLLALMAKLRAPDGCPWDREQTWMSLREFIIEEAYELVDAIEAGDPEKVADECGDVLFQVAFMSQIAAEEGLFGRQNPAGLIHEKLVRRHPHVFAEAHADTPAEVLDNWETLKQAERAKENKTSAVDGVGGMPALMRAHKLGKRAARVGFDWPDIDGVLAKIDEEIGELREALASGDKAHIEHELGDAIFALCQLGRQLDVNPEEAGRQATQRFEQRFRVMETAIEAAGKTLGDMEIDEMESFWQAAKRFLAEPKG